MIMVGDQTEPVKMKAALAMAARGFSVFPVRGNTKDQPLIKEWQYAASDDPSQLEAWWARWPDANIGVVTTGSLVLDVDIKKGQAGFASLMDLEISYDTFTVSTPSRGLHLYFSGADVPNSVGRLGPGLDVRGHHGYVLGPGSSIDGRSYEIQNDGPIQPAPASLVVQAGRREADLVRGSAPVADLDTISSVDRVTHFLRDEAPVATEGLGGDLTTFKVAAACKDMGVSAPMALMLLSQHWNARCKPPWSMDDLDLKVRNAYRYGAKAPGSDTPEALFGGAALTLPHETRRDPLWFHDGDPAALTEEWLFHNIAPARGSALVTAPTGAGKTFYQLEIARCLATGKALHGTQPDERGATLFIFSGTEGSGFPLRLKALGEAEALPIAARTLTKSLREGNELAHLMQNLEEKCAEMLARYGVPVRLIVFETLSASGLLKDENDNAQASDALRALASMAHALGVLFITSHHPPKSGAGSRGAGAIDAAADYIIEISREHGGHVRDVELRKARNAAERKLGSFSLVEVEVGKDSRGRPVTSMAVSQGEVRGPLLKTAQHSEIFFQSIEFAVQLRQKLFPGTEYAERDDVLKYWKELCKIENSGNRSTAFKKVSQWAIAMGQLEISPDGLFRKKELKI